LSIRVQPPQLRRHERHEIKETIAISGLAYVSRHFSAQERARTANGRRAFLAPRRKKRHDLSTHFVFGHLRGHRRVCAGVRLDEVERIFGAVIELERVGWPVVGWGR
jgi:hypothetical protein